MIEDSEDDAFLLVHELRRAGYDPVWRRVDTAERLEHALASDSWDLVVSDYRIPGFSGPEALTIVKSRCSDLPFLFVSGYPGDESVLAAVGSGASDFIVKGKLDRFVPAMEQQLREAVARRRALSETEQDGGVEDLERLVDERTAELRRSNDELEWFATAAAHELSEPLRMVATYTELLADRLHHRIGSDPEAGELLDYALLGARRMQRVVRDLLAAARPGGGEPFETRVDCERALGAALENLRLSIRERGAVVTHDPLPFLSANETAIVSLFQNLVDSALKLCWTDSPSVHVRAQRDLEHWVFSVTGDGADVETFDESGDTGIVICRRIVEAHGGRFWVDSERRDGSTFCFTLPTSSGDEGAAAHA
jgi:light-regulated signal transduction histidine kinase (bacteriophytochrome)